METQAGRAAKDSSKMKRRAEDSPCQFPQTQFVTKSAGEHDACSINQITMRLPSGSTDWLPRSACRLIGAGDAALEQRCANFLDHKRINLPLLEQKPSQPMKI
jgi:hypothetical protein